MSDPILQAIQAACATGGWHLGQMKYDGTTLKVRADNGSWSSLLRGNLAPQTYTLGSGTIGYDGKILEIMATDIVLSDADFNNIRSYCNDRYGLSV